jgi:acyl carrier protein
MERAIAVAEQRFGPINGVIHAAGVPDGALIPLRTDEVCEAVLAPKIRGTLILDRLLNGRQLDFFVLCSSLASIQAPIGQVGYCAASAFLDAFAFDRTVRNGTFTLAINWDTWQQVGMAVEASKKLASGLDPASQSQLDQAIENGLLTSQGVEVFRRCLSGSLPQVVVSTQDLQMRMRASRAQSSHLTAASGVDDREISAHARPDLETEYVAPRNDVERTIAEQWQQMLGIDSVGVHDSFFELGGDSLCAIQLLPRIRARFGADLPMATFFNGPTVAEVAAEIMKTETEDGTKQRFKQLTARVKNMSDEEKRDLLEQARRAREGTK